MNIPVVFMQRSDVYPTRSQEYVKVALRQAKRYNERVVLLGDEGTKSLNVESLGVEYHDICSYDQVAYEFENNIYIHMSTNAKLFEIAAIQCAYLLAVFMETEGIKAAALCETDTMLHCNMSDIYSRRFTTAAYAHRDRITGASEDPHDFLAAYSVPRDQPDYRWSASFHASLWTLDGIGKLCSTIAKGYTTDEGLAKIRSKWDFHQEKGSPGGVCIMTFLYFLSQEAGVVNLSAIKDGSVFDHNIRVPENNGPDDFEMETVEGYSRPVKKITWQDGKPHGHLALTDQLIRFNALHFNSSSKVLMPVYQTREE